jgi:hypothetical protein
MDLDARADAARHAHLERHGISGALPWKHLKPSEQEQWRDTARQAETVQHLRSRLHAAGYTDPSSKDPFAA